MIKNPWLQLTKSARPAKLRLFCFPYAGGGTASYRSWPTFLPPYIEVLALQLPGRESRISESPFDRMEPLIDSLKESIAPYCDKPFAFFGHSMGAIVSFELARALRRNGQPMPSLMMVSGRRAPQVPDPDPPEEPVHGLPDEEFIQELQKMDGTPPEVLEHEELMSLLLPILRADFAVCETYRHHAEPPLDVPIVAMGGLRDPDLTRASLQAWAEQTTGTLTLRMFPGDHFYVKSDERRLMDVVTTETARIMRI